MYRIVRTNNNNIVIVGLEWNNKFIAVLMPNKNLLMVGRKIKHTAATVWVGRNLPPLDLVDSNKPQDAIKRACEIADLDPRRLKIIRHNPKKIKARKYKKPLKKHKKKIFKYKRKKKKI